MVKRLVVLPLLTAIVFLVAVLALSGCGSKKVKGEKVGQYSISVSTDPDPATVGRNTMRIVVRDAQGEPLTGANVHVHYSMPAMPGMGMPGMADEAEAKEKHPGTYEAELDLSAGGKFPWDVKIEIVKESNIIAVSQWRLTPETEGIKFISGEGEEASKAPQGEMTSPSGGSISESQGDVDYYTCTMHPSVKQKDPGKCPICGMDLVPVRKTTGTVTQTTTENQKALVNISLYQQQLIGVQFDTVVVSHTDQSIRTVGIVAANERKLTSVNLKFSGWVEKLYADYEGKKLRKGDPLFDIYSPELVSTQEEYLQSLQRKGNLDLTSTADSMERSSYVRNAEERLRLWGLSDEQIREIARRGSAENTVTINSPIDGYVLKKNIIEGSVARAGTDLFTIADLSTVWIYADVYEYELPLLKVGQKSRVTLSNDRSMQYSGSVDYVYPILDKKTRAAKVRIVVPNPNIKLKPEMYADVELINAMGKDLTVAETAVLNTGTRQLVFVSRGNGRFEPREVKLGPKTGNRYVVVNGLRAGDIVVSSGNFLIDAEAHVQGVLKSMQ